MDARIIIIGKKLNRLGKLVAMYYHDQAIKKHF